MSTMMLSAKLDRSDSTTPWGFRMHGGKDFGCPLTIQRVTPGSLAAKCGLQVGDVILRIGDVPTDVLVHKEAQGRIISSSNFLELTLQRQGNLKTTPGSPLTRPQNSYSPSPLATGQPAFQAPAPVPEPPAQDHNRSAAPFMPGGGGAPVNNQYNSPINMYSADSAANSLANTSLGPPSQGSDHSSQLSHGVTYGGDASLPNSVHAPNLSNIPSPTLSDSNYDSTHTVLLTNDTYEPLVEKWTLDSDSKTQTTSRSPDEEGPQRLPRRVSTGVLKPRHPTSSGGKPGGKQLHRKITPVPTDVSPMKVAIKSSRFEDVAEGEEIRYHGYTNPNVQSNTFKKLQEVLKRGEDPSNLGPKSVGKLNGKHATSTVDAQRPIRGAPFRISGTVPEQRQYNTPVGLYGNSFSTNSSHVSSSEITGSILEEKKEEKDEVEG